MNRYARRAGRWLCGMTMVAALVLASMGFPAGVDAAPKTKAKAKPVARVASKTTARSARTSKAATPKPQPQAPIVDISTICIQAESGLVISEHNADFPRPAASMVKMMLLLLVSEGMREGRWTPETKITVTSHAQNMGGSQVYLKADETFTLDQLMHAVAVKSANDAAMAVAEGLWGSEAAYLQRMNERAAEIGMKSAHFTSVHGLPPDKGEEPDRVTARDMARLGQFCVMDPTIRAWTNVKEYVFRPGESTMFNTNKLLWRMDGACDGVKTGFTRGAGFCVTATAVRDGIRLIAVVMGADGKRDRFDMGEQLLEEGFASVVKKRVIAKGDKTGEPMHVENCENASVQLVAADDLSVVIKKEDVDNVQIVPQLTAPLKPPVGANAIVGEAVAEVGGKPLGSVPLVTPVALAEAGWRWKLMQSVSKGKASTK